MLYIYNTFTPEFRHIEAFFLLFLFEFFSERGGREDPSPKLLSTFLIEFGLFLKKKKKKRGSELKSKHFEDIFLLNVGHFPRKGWG